MIEILQSIGNFFTSIGEFVVNLIKHTNTVIHLLGNAITQTNTVISWFFPPAIIATMIAFIAVIVIYKVLGRT